MNGPALIDKIRADYPATEYITLDFNSLKVRVGSNSGLLAAELRAYYSEFLSGDEKADILVTAHECPDIEPGHELRIKEPDPGKTKIKEEYADIGGARLVRKRLTGMCFIFNGSEHVAAGPCLANSNQVVNFINNRHIAYLLNRGALLAHAAAVTIADRGVSLCGFSGAGKSTLSLKLLDFGGSFISNDRLMISRNGDGVTMDGVAKMPRINPGTVLNDPNLSSVIGPERSMQLKELPEDELWSLEEKYDVFMDEVYGPGRFRLSHPMEFLFVLNWKRGGGPAACSEVKISERLDFLQAFMKSEGLFYLNQFEASAVDRSEEAYVRALEGVRVFEVSGGTDFEGAAALIGGKVSGVS